MCPICIRFSSKIPKIEFFSDVFDIFFLFIVQKIAHHFMCFRSEDAVKDLQLYARIQIELDTFVLRSSNFIYLSRFLGAWQYLVILPFSELHLSTIWKLYYMLTAGFSHDTIENVADGM